MEDKTKKTVAGLTAGAIGVAGAGIVAGNIISDKQVNDVNDASINNPAIIAEDNSNNDVKVTEAVTELTGVTTTTVDSSKTSETYTSTIDNDSTATYVTTMSKVDLVDSGVSVLDMTKDTSSEIKQGLSTSETTSSTKDNVSDVDIECYELMKDANAYSLRGFNSEYSSLSDALVSTYGVELSDAQKARYDTVAKDTYDAYMKAIAAYESGDIETFRKICDDVLNGKKYLNLDDLVDILSININLQGDYIKNSSNYSISDGKLIIDGISLDSLFPEATYVDQFNVMSLINFYGKDSKSDNRVLDIMQAPIFVIKQATKPTNMTLVNSNTVYAYDNAKLRERFEDIGNNYSSKLGLDRFNFNVYNGKHELVAYDNDNNKHVISEDNEYYSGLCYYIRMLNQYRKSDFAKVGYFVGNSMKDFLSQFENGIENIKVPGMVEVLGDDDYDCYSLMQDANGYSFYRFNSQYSSLSDALVSNYGVELTDAQKVRYDTVMGETYEVYKKGIDAYQSGRVSEFRKICDDVLNSKKYLNLDDLIDILSININSQDKIINDSSNYSISNGKLVIDGTSVESLFDVPNYVDHSNIMSFFGMYDGATSDDLRVLNIMQVPIYVANEAVSPTSFCLMCDGDRAIYSYRNEELGKWFNDINNYFVENTGLNSFGYEMNGNSSMIYGFDNDNQKQYISSESDYYRDLSNYIINLYPRYQRSKDGRIGYFDGQMLKDYLNRMSNNYEKGATK